LQTAFNSDALTTHEGFQLTPLPCCLTEVPPSPPPCLLSDSVGVDTEGKRFCWSLCWSVFCFCMSSALQTAFTFDGTDDARRLSVYTLPCCLTEVLPSPPPSPLCLPSDSVGVDTEGKRFCWSLCWSVFCFACLPLCKPLSHSSALKTDKVGFTVPHCLTEVPPSRPPSSLIAW
jgi:hypothetical protein